MSGRLIASTDIATATGSGNTITASAPLLDLSQTWNNASVTFAALKLNIGDTASNAASMLVDLQVASSRKFAIRKDGAFLKPVVIAYGTTSANDPPFVITQTWNNSGVQFVGDYRNITNTASDASSLIATWNVGFQPRFLFGIDGSMTLANNLLNASTRFAYSTATHGVSSELTVLSTNAAYNSLALQNNSTAGFSAVAFRDPSGNEHGAVGFANSATGAPFTGYTYIEGSDLTAGHNVAPPPVGIFQTGYWNSLWETRLRLAFDNNGNTTFYQWDGSTVAFKITNTGVSELHAVKFAGANGTGAGSAALGANSPASTLTAPYTWITVTTADGSTAYIPAWK